MKTNILITSAGKRVTLTLKFRETLRRFYPQAKVFTTDLNPSMAPACHVSDGFVQVPRVTDPSYIDELITVCRAREVGVLIPTIDTELAVLSSNKARFRSEGVEVMVPDPEFVRLCRDKRNTSGFFQSHDIRVPRPVDIHNPAFPIFAKPYDGSLSKDLHVIRSPLELTPDIVGNPKLIFMEYIDKLQYTEYTVDMYYGRDNRLKSVVPRERVEVRAGEINKGFTRKNCLVSFLRDRLDPLEGVIGCICLQLFFRPDDRDVVGIEVNPRFGGGYPLSYCAGANFAEFIIREYMRGESLSYDDSWLDNTLMLRFDSEIIIYDKT